MESSFGFWQINDFCSIHLGQTNIEVQITNVEKEPFHYTIPSFPVMTLDLLKVTYKLNGMTYLGVVDAKKHLKLTAGNYICTSYCEICYENSNYMVLWELQDAKPLTQPSIMVNESTNLETDNETDISNKEGAHCVPFKVLGTCYSSSRQKALEVAYDCMYEYNRPVFVKLEAEPENQHDKNAIAVYIMSTNECYEKVGYIANELTKYLHEPLKVNALDITVKEIHFRTTFMLVGYYMTIHISKKGVWDDAVIKAGHKIK